MPQGRGKAARAHDKTIAGGWMAAQPKPAQVRGGDDAANFLLPPLKKPGRPGAPPQRPHRQLGTETMHLLVLRLGWCGVGNGGVCEMQREIIESKQEEAMLGGMINISSKLRFFPPEL